MRRVVGFCSVKQAAPHFIKFKELDVCQGGISDQQGVIGVAGKAGVGEVCARTMQKYGPLAANGEKTCNVGLPKPFAPILLYLIFVKAD